MSRKTRATEGPPDRPDRVADAVLAPSDVVYLPVKHHSPVVAFHVGEAIAAVRPAVVLIEGPDEATEHLPWLAHADAAAPLLIQSRWVDKREGRQVVRRYPLTPASPEWVALRTAAAVGAVTRFIDAPVKALAAAGDPARSADRFFPALGPRGLDGFWDDHVEAQARRWDGAALWRLLVTLAAAERLLGEVGPVDLLREAHMRWHIDQARADAAGPVVVVVGAWHAAALPWTRGRRATRADAATSVAIAGVSPAALAREASVDRLAWREALLAALRDGHPTPAAEASLAAMLAAARGLRAGGHAASTAEVAAAWSVAWGLARHRGRAEPVVADVADAAVATFGKGASADDARAAVAEAALGDRRGRLPEGAGQPPLAVDFWSQVKALKLDLDDGPRVLRCDVGKNPTHQTKSAFLHRCLALELPMFEALDAWGGEVVRMADPASGDRQRLLGESWSVCRSPDLDLALLDLAADGETIEAVVVRRLLDEARGGADVAAACERVVTAALADLGACLPALGAALEAALAVDRSLVALLDGASALATLAERRHVPLHDHPALQRWIVQIHAAACGELDQLRAWPDDRVGKAADGIADLSRGASHAGPGAVERLVQPLRRLADDLAAPAWLRGAVFGALVGLDQIPEARLVAALVAAGRGSDPRDAARFLEGLLRSRRTALMGSRRLLAVVDRWLLSLTDEVFMLVVPDLRRAFTSLSPAELARLASRIASPAPWIGGAAPPPDGPALAHRLEAMADKCLAKHMNGHR